MVVVALGPRFSKHQECCKAALMVCNAIWSILLILTSSKKYN